MTTVLPDQPSIRPAPPRGRGRIPAPSGPPPVRQRGDVRRVFRLFRPFRGRLAFVGLLIVVSSLVSLASPFLLRDILDESLPRRETGLTVLLAGGMILIAALTTVLNVIQSRQSTVVGQGVMHRLRSDVYAHLQRLSLAFYTKTRTGEVQSRIAGDIGSMQATVTSTATSIISSGTTVIGTLVAMLALNWKLTLVSLVLVPVFVLISRKVGSLRRSLATRRQEIMADLSTAVAESLSVSGILLTRTMGQSEKLISRFDASSEQLADLEIRSAMAGRWRQSIIGIVVSILPAAIYLAAAFAVSGGAGLVSIGTLVAFTTLQSQLLRPLMSLLSTGVDVQTSMAMFRRVFEYLDLPVDVAEPARPRRLPAGQQTLRFADVSFHYAGAATETLRHIDLELAPGRHVAVVGATGSGKTTLGYLGARLYEPDSGAITLGGIPLSELARADLAREIGIVSQETYLLHASIADNLRFAKPDAADAELVAAARVAQIHELIAGLPDGYATVVGERGYRFSGGEKQRLAIARMVLRNPPILILDEATSALDTRTEAAVSDALTELARGRTVLTIAHRLSTVADADEIVVMDGGRIVERGPHQELLDRRGAYAALVSSASVGPASSPPRTASSSSR